MENFFLNLNAFDTLKVEIFKNYQNERICVLTKNEKLKLELCKNHVIEQNQQNADRESVKACVMDYANYRLLKKNASVCSKSVYLIFNKLDDLLNAHGLEESCVCVLNPICVLNNFETAKKSVYNFCQKLLFSLSGLLFQSLVDKTQFYSGKIVLEIVSKCLNFFNNNENISIFNYFEFSILLKKLLLLKEELSFKFFNKILFSYGLICSKKANENALAFLLIWLEREFVKQGSFFKLQTESFVSRFCDSVNVFNKKTVIDNAFNYFKTDEIRNLIKANKLFFEKELEKIYKLSDSFVFNEVIDKCNFSASIFLKSVNLACDDAEINIFQFMKNLGYLNVA